MDQLKLDAESITEMKSFYQEELAKTLRKLEHLNEVLSQLGAKGAQIQMSFADSSTPLRKSKNSAPKRKYKKKRGPKSKWDKAIIKTITSAGRPLSYDEITDFLMISEGRDASKRKNTKATVQNTVFRLRHDKKLNTFSMGARTKYIAPKTWFESNGEIKEEFKNKITLPKKAKKPGPKTAKRRPGRPRKKVTQTKAKVIPAVKAKKAEVKKAPIKTTAKKAIGTKASTTSKAKTSATKSVAKPAVSKVTAKKKITSAKSNVKKSTGAKKSTAIPQKSAAIKSSVVKKSTPKKSPAKKKVDPKAPRKIAMTKTVRTRKKK